jgi:trimeric autotransporter adhesin
MNPLIELKIQPSLFRLVLCLACFGLVPLAEAVLPPPDGAYPGGNTAEGQNALLSLTTGGFNTAVGFLSLRTNAIGQFNTALGAGTLLANIADQNTATGAGALLSNTTGTENTANGAFALFSNTEGGVNTANGVFALFNNTTGIGNTANGWDALSGNPSGINTTALGVAAGQLQTTGDGNVYIGANMVGVAGESNACYIRSIFNQTSTSGIPVLINSSNKLGTTTSSKRFKEEIKSMDKASEAVFALKPVTFRYKKDLDP